MITIKSFEFNYFQENTFLLYDDTREAVLIDCGCCRKEEEKELTDFILENKFDIKAFALYSSCTWNQRIWKRFYI